VQMWVCKIHARAWQFGIDDSDFLAVRGCKIPNHGDDSCKAASPRNNRLIWVL